MGLFMAHVNAKFTLDDLRRRINPSSPSSVRISLNRKDEFVAPSEDTIRSLGLTSSDLIYYFLEPSAFNASSLGITSSSEAQQNPVCDLEDSSENLGDQKTLVQEFETVREIESNSTGNGSVELGGVPENHHLNMDVQKQTKSDLNFGGEEPIAVSGMEGPEPMDVEFYRVGYADAKRLSEPFFLKKVVLEECTDTSESMIMVMAVHAVMLESGFLLLDPESGVRAEKFSFSKETANSISLIYTLPELITRSDPNKNETVSLKFQSIGPMLVVYGSLGGTSSHRVYLDRRRLVPTIDLVMETLKSNKEGSSRIYSEVFEFWRMVKDGVAMPLLIGLCDMAGLELPPCLMRLPTELKFKILESLHGADIARVACVCSEMRFVAKDNNLWKQKCLEECGDLVNREEYAVSWKAKFAAFWEKRWRGYNRVPGRIRPPFGRVPPIWRDPFPMGFPPVAWHDGDRYGVPADHLPFRLGHLGTGIGQLRGRDSWPRCYLGGLN
ncbi:PREDICTED: F-box protein SKIP22-like [Tarenaya hassleriana]|uniref:F-box protein SKIP22-like n=1 Tax=Tarenaya hassleriana TaxID=28532 RepID=UPI00053C6699|nr:PREDICTED: F-box protein SKIP22-like [Tarenaya hassleriana]